MNTYYGVYRVLKNGDHQYVKCTVTNNKSLAEEIADDFTKGIVIRPDGSTKYITPHPHISKKIPKEEK